MDVSSISSHTHLLPANSLKDPVITKATGKTDPIEVMAKLREMKNSFKWVSRIRKEALCVGTFTNANIIYRPPPEQKLWATSFFRKCTSNTKAAWPIHLFIPSRISSSWYFIAMTSTINLLFPQVDILKLYHTFPLTFSHLRFKSEDIYSAPNCPPKQLPWPPKIPMAPKVHL